MLTIKEWADQFAAARARAPLELAAAVAANAKVGAEIARSEIGHLQPALVIGPPAPARFPVWEPLAPSTIEDKTALGFGPPDYDPLYRTGQMHASIDGVADGLTGAVVSDDPVAVYHEFGTSRMPPRPFLSRAVAMTMPAFREVLGRLSFSLLKPKP